MTHILIINGPNLNLLGTREPHIYGSDTLIDVSNHLDCIAQNYPNVQLNHFQSNNEGDLVTCIQQAQEWANYIIINAGAYTHTSVAIRDALLAVAVPFVEVHISNVYARETFRQNSYLSDRAMAVISGLGVYGYEAALHFCLKK